MKKLILSLVLLAATAQMHADEGMWMLGNLNKESRKSMKELGLKLSADKLYHPKKASLSDAVVSFGGFCSGVVVSADGLVFTNHHCGFDAIQQHSSVENDYLENGFVARNRQEELPNPELYVRFLLHTEDVTKRILAGLNDGMDEFERDSAVDSLKLAIQEEVHAKDSTLVPVVDTYYGGNEFWLSVYRDYEDVRLVYAPPSSVGKFGWDTDNWVWPRHTGDFSVFRIYAGKDNKPAAYAADNVPYKAKYFAPVSLDGYKEGSFCMTLGYPGSTDRYLSSFGIEERINNMNQAIIDMRTVKQAIWKEAMNNDPEVRIKYASKYDESSNYWKNSIGMNNSMRKLKVMERKRERENNLQRWITERNPQNHKLMNLLPTLEQAYKDRKEADRAGAYFGEAFLNGPELIQAAIETMNFDYEAEDRQVVSHLRQLLEKYENLNPELDKQVFVAMLNEYRNKVDSAYLPAFYARIADEFEGNNKAFVDHLYTNTKLDSSEGLKLFLEADSTYNIMDDPAISVSLEIIMKYFELMDITHDASAVVTEGERLFNAAVRQMYAEKNYYPDANMTMRLSFGTVRGYTPHDGTTYDHYTTTTGILEKAKAHQGDRDFGIQPQLTDLLASGNYGRYADKNGEMNVCFISDNDITGGNSGSAMFNEKGALLGLAFDGNWEAMTSDYQYEPALQRCIGVDVRYMLFIMEKYGKAEHLIKELKISK